MFFCNTHLDILKSLLSCRNVGMIWAVSNHKNTMKDERNILFNDALNTFYLHLYSTENIVKNHSDSERGNLLSPLHGLLFPISSKGSFIFIILYIG